MNHYVIVALGSNTNPEQNISVASDELAGLLHSCHFSHTIWTYDIHHTGVKYLNRLVAGYTDMTVDELDEKLKTIENLHHRSRHEVTIDLDLMQYDGVRYHLKDWPRPYIQRLINEIE